MKQYILCEFQYGYTGQFYIENIDGTFIRFVDLYGTTMDLHFAGEPGFKPYGYIIIDNNHPTPSWA